LDQPSDLNEGVIRVFNHHLYELSRGIRPLSMLTMTKAASVFVEARLVREGVAYYVHEACPTKLNVVFGRPAAVEAARRFLTRPLCDLSPEHDFMLGILLGYDREQQCVRYLERSASAGEQQVLAAPDFDDKSASWLDAAVEANPERAH
jgi:hypothetical protein